MSTPEHVQRARRLLAGVEKNHSPAVFGCGFGAADMVVLDLIARDGLALETFTIDTGRLPPETHALIGRVRRHYGLEIRTLAPWPETVDAYAAEYGIDGFYDAPEAREACCAIRRGEPLRRALARKRAWITARRSAAEAALDPAHGIWTFAPLAGWSDEQVWDYLRQNHVPWNALHDRGFAIVGCEPCTSRKGRWSWEGPRTIPIEARQEA